MGGDRNAQRKLAAVNVGDLAVERHAGGGGQEIDRDQPRQARYIAKPTADGRQRTGEDRVIERSHEQRHQHAGDDEPGFAMVEGPCGA